MSFAIRTIRNLVPFVRYTYSGERVACNVCGCAETIEICTHDRRLKPLSTVACRRCGLLRTDPMPTEAELERYYADEYRFDYQFVSKKPPRFHRIRRAREARERLLRLSPLLKPGARILDFGSGSGEFLAAAQAAGHNVLGVEPGKAYAVYAREAHGVEVINAPLAKAEIPGVFDLITANHVIEHLRDPAGAMALLASKLAEGGALYVAVPDISLMGGRPFERFHFAHVYNFTPRTLTLAGEAAGLEPDPRLEPESTMIAFRRRNTGPAPLGLAEDEGPSIAARYEKASPASFLLSGKWIGDAARRLAADLKDTRGR